MAGLRVAGAPNTSGALNEKMSLPISIVEKDVFFCKKKYQGCLQA